MTKELERGKEIYVCFHVSDEMTGAIAFCYTDVQYAMHDLMKCGYSR